MQAVSSRSRVRRLLVLVALAVLGAMRGVDADAQPLPAPARPTIDIGLAFAIPRDERGRRVVDDAWVKPRIDEANRLWGAAGLHFRWTIEDDLPEAQREAHTREDRDALAPLVVVGHVRIAVVTELEDVDEPGRRRMGVCWTARRDGRRYILLASYSVPGVLAHELGHLLGNGHSKVEDNLMSYERTGAEVFVDGLQTSRARATATTLLANGVLVDVGPPRRVP